MLIKNKYRKDCHATAIGYRRCCYDLPTFFNWATGMSVLRLRLSSHIPHPFSRASERWPASYIIGEKARGRIESCYIISGKFGGNKPAKINWFFRWAWPSPYFIYHSRRSRAKWAFSLFPLGALLLRVQYLPLTRESTLAVTCVYIWTTVDQEGIRSCRLSHIAGVAYILIYRNQLQSIIVATPKFDPAQRSVCYSSSCGPCVV